MTLRVEFTRAFDYWANGITPEPKPSSVNLFHNPRYVVLRAAPGFSLPDRLDGLWLEVARISTFPFLYQRPGEAQATASAAGRYEKRDDGLWAEVYEVSW